MFVVMFSSGMRQFSPFMLFIPMSIALGSLSYMGVGGQGGGSLSEMDSERKSYFLELRERRKEVHARGEAIHTLELDNFPNPKSLLSLISRPTMWQASGAHPVKEEPGLGPPPPLSPYLMARIGVGTIRMYPKLKPADIQIPENMEPLTTIAHTSFLRNQSGIPNTPIGLSLRDNPLHSFQGDEKMILALGRAMITSLAYNHSPQTLALGIVSANLSNDDWDWMKWLPHNQDQSRRDTVGSARLAWHTLGDFARQMNPVISERGSWSVKPSGESPFYVIFIDTPGTMVSLPDTIPQAGVAGVAFVVLRRASVEFSGQLGRYSVAPKTGFSTPKRTNIVTPDQMSVLAADVVARKMSRYRPRGWGSMSIVSEVEESTPLADKTYFDILGITDIDKFDPRDHWKRNRLDSNFKVPIGFEHDGNNALDKLVTLDISEASVGGTGPHGVFQGVTGAGKSFLLTAYVLTMCAYFGPEKLNMILMDFKGGATFPGFQNLPHVVANITNLDNEVELVARLGDVVDGEVVRREQLLKDHDAKDIGEYRKMSLRDPVQHPPLPDLVLIADEFREFMQEHKSYLTLFTRIGAVGRSLGIHILPCSQYIDSTLLRELMEHLTFGISLRSSSDNYSRVVIGNTEAAKLPLGTGQAIIRKTGLDSGEYTTRFVGFNTEEQYVPSKQAAVIPDITSPNVRLVEAFGITNKFPDAPDTNSDTGYAMEKAFATDFPKSQQMKLVLLRHLAKFTDVMALQLWKPTLRAPITFADVDVKQAESTRLSFHIGDIDAPRQHTRLPYMISPESGNEHILIEGRGHSGRSTAVQALVCSSGRAYPARYVSWCLIDYGGTKLGEVAEMPNVSGYATKTDTDKIERFIGEALRIRRLRESVFSERGLSSLDAYLASREESPVPDDPYGHLFLVIDGYSSFAADHEDATSRLTALLDGGGRYGIHVVLTTDKELKMFSILSFFGSRVYLKMDDPNELGNLPRESREAIRLIPPEQPGRALDPISGLSARILVPQFERIEPLHIDAKSQMPIFDPIADYSPGIRTFSAMMRAAYTDPAQLAPVIETVPAVIDYPILWSIYDINKIAPDPEKLAAGRRLALDIHHPLGISAEDLTLITAPDSISPHLLTVGDPQTGKTETLRSTINSIVRQLGPDEAQIVIAETKYEFLPEKELLEDMGYLLAYADTSDALDKAVSIVDEVIRPRSPSLEQNLSMATMRDRSWYSGPEVFILIDDANSFATASANYATTAKSGMETLIDLVNGRPDLGLHVYTTGPAQGFAMTSQTNKLYTGMLAKNSAMVLLSGPPKEGPLPGQAKFAKRRAGQGLLYTPADNIGEVIQLGHSPSWEEPGAAPPQEIIDRARAIKAALLGKQVGTKPVEQRTWFDAIEIIDLEHYDPRTRWLENSKDSNFDVPLGFKHDGTRLLDDLVTLDIAEAAERGSGPHGSLQGVTGSGKSMMLNSYVLTLCAYFGPEKLNLVLMDFKGGATFSGYEKLPHTVASITNLNSEEELVARMGDVIEGEIIRREKLLRDNEAKDIVTYRKMFLRDPIKYPPLPDLVIIADEFREFMVTHKDYLTLFTRIGAVGRSLGMHIVPCSQYIDASLLRELMEHLTFGISLKASSDSFSKTVIGSADAAHLSLGSWQAFIRETDKSANDQLFRFVGFNSEERYIAGGGQNPNRAERDVPRNDQMKHRLIDRIAEFDEVKALPLWQPTLRAPITYANITVKPATTTRLSFRIGDIDAPKQHIRLPYMISPESGNEHTLIVGRGHSGTSTAVQAMACASAISYAPRYVSWYLIDYGGTKLGEIALLPNVGGYATKAEPEKVERLIAEAIRIRQLREKVFTQRKLSTMDAYIKSREKNPVSDDPYGHLFLVIDGYISYLSDHDEARNRLLQILDGGGRYGLHMVATVGEEVKLAQQAQFFGTRLLLKVEDAASLLNVPHEVREANKLMPKDQPGRAVDLSTGLSARILVPQDEPITSSGIDARSGLPDYNSSADYSPGIRRLVARLRAKYPDTTQLAPVIETVASVIDYPALWEVYDATRTLPDPEKMARGRRPVLDIKIPLGMSAEDLSVTMLPDSVSPHWLVIGDPKTGRTEALRSAVNSIIRQFDPTQAQIVIAETKFELLPEKELLEDMGYLLAYADSDAALTRAVTLVDKLIRPRSPSLEQKLSMSTIRNRSWYTGPEIFVLIDNMTAFSRGTASGMTIEKSGVDTLVELVKLRSDLGLHIYLTGQAQKFSATRTMNKLCESLIEANTAMALLSGPRDEPSVSPGIKFAFRKPGEALLYTPDNAKTEVVQLAHAPTWEEHGAAPPEEIIARARAVKPEPAANMVGEDGDSGELSGNGEAQTPTMSEPVPGGQPEQPKKTLSGRRWGVPPG
jgi:S-DNA-T family DNA segregation ATPase FtsK/SpoIIIE